MTHSDWSDSPYRKDAREQSIQQARERIREAEREAAERKCRCRKPLPGRVYLGVPLCHLCQRLIYHMRRSYE